MRKPTYCTDEELDYARSGARIDPNEPYCFDESYRVAHLPLVAPEHPAVIDRPAQLDYERGRYARPRFSLVLPVDAADLQRSASFRALESDLRAQMFSRKIAWDMLALRAAKLHVTLAGALPEAGLDACASAASRFLERWGPLSFRLGGPFCGTRNRGRIYFKVYPERLDDADAFGLLQELVQVPRKALYLLGYYNLREELSAAEAAELHAFLERRGSAELAELSAASLLLLGTHDDLALDSRVVARFPA